MFRSSGVECFDRPGSRDGFSIALGGLVPATLRSLHPQLHLALLRVDDRLAAVLELAEEELLGERVLDRLVEHAREGTGAEGGVEALLGEERAAGVGQLERDL